MDKSFWLSLKQTNYKLPAGQNLLSLTEELFSFIPSSDPELRDTIAYETFANWLEQGLYSPDQMRAYILRLIMNVQNGLGERGTDTVFGRTFSILCLAEIVHHDNKQPFLDKDETLNILDKGLAYLADEVDPRGYVPKDGWAHALAHTADLFFVLASNRFLGREHLEQILQGIATKLITPTDWVYIHGEDDRLTRAVLAVYQRNLVSQDWLTIFASPNLSKWIDSFKDQSLHNAYFNSKTFLRSLYSGVLQVEELENKENILSALQNTLKLLRQF
jgi:hypothetical protein